jgi:hypothetical protein
MPASTSRIVLGDPYSATNVTFVILCQYAQRSSTCTPAPFMEYDIHRNLAGVRTYVTPDTRIQCYERPGGICTPPLATQDALDTVVGGQRQFNRSFGTGAAGAKSTGFYMLVP